MIFRAPKPFPVLASILTLAGVLVLLWLGHWQQERLIWKNNLQAALDQEFAKDATTARLQEQDLEQVTGSVIKRGALMGWFDFDKQVILRGQIAEGQSVNYVLIPFRMGTDNSIFVVAGYQEGIDFIPAPFWKQRGRHDIITGIARIPSWSHFVPENEPEKDLWYRADTSEISRELEVKHTFPALFYLETSNVKLGTLKPVEVSRQLRNDHRQYMFFWYTMAAILSVMYFLRFWRKTSD